MFGIEESEGVLAHGLEAVVEVAKGLKAAFDSPSKPISENGSPERFCPTVGFFTFSPSCLRFFSCNDAGEVSVHLVTDVKDSPFAALPASAAGFDVVSSLDKLQELVKKVPSLISQHTVPSRSNNPEPCSGAAILALGDSLLPTGGKGYLITTMRPTFGSLSLRKVRICFFVLLLLYIFILTITLVAEGEQKPLRRQGRGGVNVLAY